MPSSTPNASGPRPARGVTSAPVADPVVTANPSGDIDDIAEAPAPPPNSAAASPPHSNSDATAGAVSDSAVQQSDVMPSLLGSHADILQAAIANLPTPLRDEIMKLRSKLYVKGQELVGLQREVVELRENLAALKEKDNVRDATIETEASVEKGAGAVDKKPDLAAGHGLLKEVGEHFDHLVDLQQKVGLKAACAKAEEESFKEICARFAKMLSETEPAKLSTEVSLLGYELDAAAVVKSLELSVASLLSKIDLVRRSLKNPAAQETVAKHIKLLHDYNTIRDVGQGLLGMVAEGRGVRISDLYDDGEKEGGFGVKADD